MKLVRTSSLFCLCLASLVAACSGPTGSESEPVGTATSAIVNGTPSMEEDDFVVDLEARAACTGTLIAPNVILTAFHCVSDYDETATFSCDNKGKLTSLSPGGGVLGDPIAPEDVTIRVGPTASMNDVDAHGVRIFAADTKNICLNDIAVVVIDTNLSPPPQQVRIGTQTMVGERLTIIGFGQDENGTSRTRNRRTGVRISNVGTFGDFAAQGGGAAPRTFTVGEGPCHGDSGGPAFSEETGAVIGVYSSVFSDCTAPGVKNIFTQVAAFENLIEEAMEYAGAELLVEPIEEPVGGSGGASAGMAGTAGSAPGGTGGTATGGSGSGGDGVAGAIPNGEAGSDSANAGRGGSRVGTGSGSREDPSCTCRLDGLASNSAPAWLGSISLLLGALIRRRRR